MAGDDSAAPLSQEGKIPQVIQMEGRLGKHTEDDGEVDINASSKLIGLSKEQLEQYRNDPFWKRLRVFMFALFWLAWIAMFAGAVFIVVLSPKCSAKTEHEWWKTKVSYQIITPTFRDSDGDGVGDFKGIEEKLDDIRKIGVENVWVTPVIATYKDDFLPYDVVDFSKVDARYGTMDQFKELVSAVHNRGMFFVMDLPIGTTSVKNVWFEDAIAGGPYREYYIWKDTNSLKGDQGYVTHAASRSSFLSYNGKDPILNWENPSVKQALLEVTKQYLDIGVDGFYVAHISQLMKNKDTASYASAAYKALEGFNTDLQKYIQTNDVLSAKKIAIFSSLDEINQLHSHDTVGSNIANLQYVLDNSVTKLNKKSCPQSIAKCFRESLKASLDYFEQYELPYVWQFTDFSVPRPTSRFDVATGNLLTFVQLTLPGSVVFYHGQELGLTDPSTRPLSGIMQWDATLNAGFSSHKGKLFFNTTNDYEEVNFETEYKLAQSPLKTFSKIAKMRSRDENLIIGNMQITSTSDDILMFNRYHQAENETVGAGYIVIANFAMVDIEVDITDSLPPMKSATAVEVVASTSNVRKYQLYDKLDLSSDKIFLNPKQGILLRL